MRPGSVRSYQAHFLCIMDADAYKDAGYDEDLHSK